MTTNNIDKSSIRYEVDEVLRCVDEYDTDTIAMRSGDLFSKIRLSDISEAVVKDAVIEIIIQMEKVIRELHGDISEVLEKDFSLYKKLSEEGTIYKLEEWMRPVIDRFSAYIAVINGNRSNVLIGSILCYITENYNQDLSLKSISKNFYVNPSYLGQQFKKEVGETFNEYLSKIRIENAKKLLKITDLKVYQIAEKVGFKDIRYFYKVYKKCTGDQPSTIRAAKCK